MHIIDEFADNLFRLFVNDLGTISDHSLKNYLEKYKKQFLDNNENDYDIELFQGWLAVKIYDCSGDDLIDKISKEIFPDVIDYCKNFKFLVRVQFHIIQPFCDVYEHVDSETGYVTTDVPVINYVRSLDDYENFILTVSNKSYRLTKNQNFIFDGQETHSAKNAGDRYVSLLVFHIDKEFYEKNKSNTS